MRNNIKVATSRKEEVGDGYRVGTQQCLPQHSKKAPECGCPQRREPWRKLSQDPA